MTDDEIKSAQILQAIERAGAHGINVGVAIEINTNEGTVREICPRCQRELQELHGWHLCGYCGPIKRARPLATVLRGVRGLKPK